jgi:glycosyltransferase involved in cell wall biosynthesis
MKDEAEPAISVAMSAYNSQDTVGRAIRSLLCQTFTDFELIIIDDGSTDDTVREILKFTDPRIRFFQGHSRKGLATRLNEAISLARGSIIARMDADDFSYPERFERQFAFLNAHNSVDLVGATGIAFRSSGKAIGAFRIATGHDDICRRPDLGFTVPHPTWMGRAAWFRKFPYPETALRAQDQAILLAAHRHSRFANLSEPLLGYHQDVPSLRSIVLGRWNYVRALSRETTNGASQLEFANGALQQVARILITAPSVALGGGEHLLKSRFRPATPGELSRFEAVRSSLG